MQIIGTNRIYCTGKTRTNLTARDRSLIPKRKRGKPPNLQAILKEGDRKRSLIHVSILSEVLPSQGKQNHSSRVIS
ncbi:hypothetical protein NDI44_04050 [Trichocoleus sp. DQ-A3]|uniref:hypothetical protein n=1 Tax=Cyanophyceae TaxID=3028117 RepID=UPI001685B513|nr:hypothetical protein [Coleofasciculus sp. FACHB-125]MBD1900883.1 hypothetical protein [Coleofasciculus sp. FACHB-125]